MGNVQRMTGSFTHIPIFLSRPLSGRGDSVFPTCKLSLELALFEGEGGS